MGISTQTVTPIIRKSLSDLLLEEKLITREKLDIALETQQKDGIRLTEALLKLAFIKPQDLAAILSVHLNLPYIDLQRHKIQPAAVRLIPEDMARKHTLIPMDVVGEWVTATGSFVPFSTFKSASWDGTSRMSMLLSGQAVTIHTGNYLALQITGKAEQQVIVTDYTQCGSYLAPPTSSPGYPLPEMSAGMLLLVGLAGLSGYLLLKRRQLATREIRV